MVSAAMLLGFKTIGECEMTNYIALLRAVNVGGTGKLPMSELKTMCINLGFNNVRTYIASGNVVFSSDADEPEVKSMLETKLESYAKKHIGVVVRTSDEMNTVLENNPFPDKKPNFTLAIFFDEKLRPDVMNDVSGENGEEWGIGEREIYVHYDNGMSQSRLKIPAAKSGTTRNMNTIAKLAKMMIVNL